MTANSRGKVGSGWLSSGGKKGAIDFRPKKPGFLSSGGRVDNIADRLEKETRKAFQNFQDDIAKTKNRVEKNESDITKIQKDVGDLSVTAEEPLEIYGSDGVIVHKLNDKRFRVTLDPKPADTGIEESEQSAYTGPFAVVKTGDTTVKVYGETTIGYPAYIILGTSRIEYTEGTVSSITASGFIYIEIAYSSGYTSTAKYLATDIPAQDNTHIYHPIAWVGCTDSKISSIIQLQYGMIHFPARAL